jgi:hypothetical protein
MRQTVFSVRHNLNLKKQLSKHNTKTTKPDGSTSIEEMNHCFALTIKKLPMKDTVE